MKKKELKSKKSRRKTKKMKGKINERVDNDYKGKRWCRRKEGERREAEKLR